MSVFARFPPRLQAAITQRLGWSSLRPVQEEAGQALLDGKNAVILAPTAGGKTEASMFPTLAQLLEDEPQGVGALYLAPIKALLNNQAERLGTYTEMVSLRRFVWHGDVGQSARRRFMREPAQLLMTTPESLEVMLISKRVDAAALFADLRMVVIDEVHAVAGTDRGAHLMSVLERLTLLSRHDLQRVGLSATVGNPEAILTWLQGSSERPGVVVDPPKTPARRELLVIKRPDLSTLSTDAAGLAAKRKTLFFCQSRSLTETVAEHMQRRGIDVFVHHSAVSAERRAEAEERFHAGKAACIVCTSTLELGIDVGDLDRVLQAEAPSTVGSFLQRMGRTGRRAGQAANTHFLCESPESVLQAVALVQLAKRGWVEDVEVHDRCWPVLVHQVFAMALASEGLRPGDAWEAISRATDFHGFSREEFDQLIQWLLAADGLSDVGGLLVLGEKAERAFGRRNFMELFAVFSSPVSYTVETINGAPIGTLSQDFVDRLVDGVSTFLLSGRAWVPQRIDHSDRTIRAQPAPRGRQPTWGGYLPQFLGFELCQEVLGILRSDEVYAYLHESARESLAESRANFRSILRSAAGGFEVRETEVLWWTFAGGRINSTLRYLLQALDVGLQASSDNFAVRVKRTSVNRLLELIARLQEETTWKDASLWDRIVDNLPGYRLSKFQRFLPAAAQKEMLTDYLLDVAGTKRWVMSAGVLGQPVSTAEPTIDGKGIGEWSGLAQRILDFEASVQISDEEAELSPTQEDDLRKLMREWAAEAVVTARADDPDRALAREAARWPTLGEVFKAGFLHERLQDQPSKAWLPAEASANYVGRLMTAALDMARAPMPEAFGKTKYPPQDLDGLEDFLLALFDLSERFASKGLGRVDRNNLARSAAQLLEPFCAKLLGLLEPQPFLELLRRYRDENKEQHLGLGLLLNQIRKRQRGLATKEFAILLQRKPPALEGWENLDSYCNALRDLYYLRHRFGHRAPALGEAEARQAAWKALVVVLALVERSIGDLADLRRCQD